MLDRGMAFAPGDYSLHANRAAALGNLGRPVEALEEARWARPGRARRPPHAQPPRPGTLRERRLARRALAEFQAAEALDPGNPLYPVSAGIALAALGRRDEACAAFQRAGARVRLPPPPPRRRPRARPRSDAPSRPPDVHRSPPRRAPARPRARPPLDDAQVLDRFVSWVAASGLTLYPAQEEAILELLDGQARGAGHAHRLGQVAGGHLPPLQGAWPRGKRSFYTCPIKALVNEKFFDLCRLFGPENVGMMTGDGAVNRDAPIVCCTAEILTNLALREASPRVDAVVMDEFHYYGDRERGVAWQVPLLLLEKATLPAHVGDARRHATPSRRGSPHLTGREVAEVRSDDRPVPLDFEYGGDAAPRDHRGAGRGGPGARSTWSTSPSAPPPSRRRT